MSEKRELSPAGVVACGESPPAIGVDVSSAEVIPARIAREPLSLAVMPLMPLGERPSATRQPADGPAGALHWLQDADARTRSLLLCRDALVLSPPWPFEKTTSAEAVLDVYVGLLELACALHSGARTAQIDRPAFIRGLGWVEPNGVMASRHYRQLAAALCFLQAVKFWAPALEARAVRHGRWRVRRLVSVLESPPPTSGGNPDQRGEPHPIAVTFTEAFLTALHAPGPQATYDVAAFASLPRGLPRAVYRAVQGLRAATTGAEAKITVNSLLERIGSTRRDLEPSKLQHLDRAHQVLEAKGIIGDTPDLRIRENGERSITYRLHPPGDLESLLRETAAAFGVIEKRASEWATTSTDRLAEVLSASIGGRLTPIVSIGAMIHCYLVEKATASLAPEAMPHFDPTKGLRQATSAGRNPKHVAYLKEQYEQTVAWLDERREVREALRSRYTSNNRPAWVVDGLVLLAARRMRCPPSLKEWMNR